MDDAEARFRAQMFDSAQDNVRNVIRILRACASEIEDRLVRSRGQRGNAASLVRDVVPVLRNAQNQAWCQVESAISRASDVFESLPQEKPDGDPS